MLEQNFMPFFGTFGWLSIMLIIGVILRAKVGLFQKFLFPASIIGGILGFILISAGVINISHEEFTKFAIFFFTINFISIGLTGVDETAVKPGSTVRKTMVRGMLWIACLWGAVFMLQALTSLGWISLTNLFSEPIYKGVAWLVPAGFANGPGQAVALGTVWQGSYKIPNMVSFGLTFAATGFLVSGFIGVPLANWGVRKGLTKNTPKELPKDFVTGISNVGKGPYAGKLTTHPGNVDGLALQLAIVMVTFFITYFVCLGMKAILPGPVKATAFGLMYLWGMIIAAIIRMILGKLGLTVYLDNNVQRRVTGVAIDFMVVATLMAVKVAVVWAHIVPITILCISAAVITTLFLLYFGNRLDHLGFERFMAVFGTSTGTAASGLMLLRIVDPDFKTPVAQEVGLMSVFCLVLVPAVFLMFTMPKVGIPINIAVSVGFFIVALTILKVSKLWGKPNWT